MGVGCAGNSESLTPPWPLLSPRPVPGLAVRVSEGKGLRPHGGPEVLAASWQEVSEASPVPRPWSVQKGPHVLSERALVASASPGALAPTGALSSRPPLWGTRDPSWLPCPLQSFHRSPPCQAQDLPDSCLTQITQFLTHGGFPHGPQVEVGTWYLGRDRAWPTAHPREHLRPGEIRNPKRPSISSVIRLPLPCSLRGAWCLWPESQPVKAGRTRELVPAGGSRVPWAPGTVVRGVARVSGPPLAATGPLHLCPPVFLLPSDCRL